MPKKESPARCAVFVGPQGTGKTTLVTALAMRATGAAPSLDAAPEAKEFGMTTDPNLLQCDYLGEAWSFIDCPGSVELMQASLDAMEAADIVILVQTPGTVCGIANIAMQPGLTPFPENAFGVVAETCMLAPTSAFAHEVGHIMGLRHDWGDNPCTDGGTATGKGYVEPGESFRTIMATSAPSAPRILNFSNPNVDSGVHSFPTRRSSDLDRKSVV